MANQVMHSPTAEHTLTALTDQCVQCGLCLPVCPTYALEQIEAESPRGRIALTRAIALETISPSIESDRYLDHCLGCGNCEAVCPAHVNYSTLLIQTRQQQRIRCRPQWYQRFIEILTLKPMLMHWLLMLYRALYPLLPKRLLLLPRPPAATTDNNPVVENPVATVALFTGCIARSYETRLHTALSNILTQLSIRTVSVNAQTCCGTLHAHAGNLASATQSQAKNRQAFSHVDTVLTLASGCHDAIASAMPDTTRAIDANDYILAHASQLTFMETNIHIGLHTPCTQRNAANGNTATYQLLARIPGLKITPIGNHHHCCGAAGTAMFDYPARASALRKPLLTQFAHSGATVLLSANIGCRLHLMNDTSASSSNLLVRHPLEFLAEYLQ